MIPRVQQVLRQTRERVLRGNTKAEGKLLSIFETHTEVIRKGKAHKPNEFGKLVLIQEAENQIVTHTECANSDRGLHLAGGMSGPPCQSSDVLERVVSIPDRREPSARLHEICPA